MVQKRELIKGNSDSLLLCLLAQQPMYGYQIIQSVIELSGGTLEWSEGMLYPVLHKMEKDDFIRSQWKISDNGRRRKYYKLTESGKEELEKEREQWMKVHKVLSKMWDPSPAFD